VGTESMGFHSPAEYRGRAAEGDGPLRHFPSRRFPFRHLPLPNPNPNSNSIPNPNPIPDSNPKPLP